MLDYLVPVACIHNRRVSAIQGSGLEGLCCRQKNYFHYNNKYGEAHHVCELFICRDDAEKHNTVDPQLSGPRLSRP